MIAVEIRQIKAFMQKLFLTETFDRFLVSDVQITTFAEFRIDGRLHREYFPDDADQKNDAPFAPWSLLRPHCLNVIRGTREPLSMRIVFRCPPDETAALLEEEAPSGAADGIDGLFMNCLFRDGSLLVTSGVSYTGFTADRSAEHAWDARLRALLAE